MVNEMSWQAPEFVHYPKGPVWFAALLVFGLGLIGFFLWRKDFLTATLFLLLVVVVLYYSRKKPRSLTIRITGGAVEWGDVHIPMKQIRSFWIVYSPPEVKTVNFETSAYLNRVLTVQLDRMDPVKLRAFLLQYLPEQLDQDEDFSQRIARKLKF